MGIQVGSRVLAVRPSWYDGTHQREIDDPLNIGPHPVVRPGWTGVVLGADPANPARSIEVQFAEDKDYSGTHYIFEEGLLAIGPIPNLTNPEEVDAWLDS